MAKHRFGVRTLGVIASVGLLSRATAATEPFPPLPKLTLVWADPDRLLRFGFDPMAQEVVEIFQDVGIEIDWRKSVQGLDGARSVLVIVHLTFSSSETWRLRHHTMGLMIPRSRPGLSRVIRVFFDEVLSTLELEVDNSRMPRARETMLLARALGRVVAHEVVHAVAPDAPHAATGLMQLQLTRAHLDSPSLRLSTESANVLHAALGRTEH
jgi:hypothetical protein